jgi:NADH:ubiquinone oxidoreductase subunit 3 (subunit A)
MIYKKIVFTFFIIFAPIFFAVGCCAEDYLGAGKFTDQNISVDIYKEQLTYSVKSSPTVNQGRFQYQDSFKDFKGKVYNGQIISFRGQRLGYFEVPGNMEIIRCSDRIDKKTGALSGGCEALPRGNISLQMPYFANGKTAEIFSDKGEKVLVIDISGVAKCNENGICDKSFETISDCPSDCPASLMTDPISADPKIKSKNFNNFGVYVIISAGIILLIVALGAVYLWKKRIQS